MNNVILLDLDTRLKYDLFDLEKKLYNELNMSVLSPGSDRILEYDSCDIQITDNNMLRLQTDYFFANAYAKYINHNTSDVLRVIESWTKDVADNQNNKRKL